jgi:hypothetical protein
LFDFRTSASKFTSVTSKVDFMVLHSSLTRLFNTLLPRYREFCAKTLNATEQSAYGFNLS